MQVTGIINTTEQNPGDNFSALGDYGLATLRTFSNLLHLTVIDTVHLSVSRKHRKSGVLLIPPGTAKATPKVCNNC